MVHYSETSFYVNYEVVEIVCNIKIPSRWKHCPSTSFSHRLHEDEVIDVILGGHRRWCPTSFCIHCLLFAWRTIYVIIVRSSWSSTSWVETCVLTSLIVTSTCWSGWRGLVHQTTNTASTGESHSEVLTNIPSEFLLKSVKDIPRLFEKLMDNLVTT